MTTDQKTGAEALLLPAKKFCCFCGHQLRHKHWEGRQRLFCDNCQSPLYENPLPASAIVVSDKNHGLLFIKRKVPPQQGFWALPGGFMELGESPEEAALRELREETGLTGEIKQLLGVAGNESLLYGTVLIVGYLVTTYSGKIAAGDDASEVAFFKPEAIPEMAFKSHEKFIRDALEYL